MNSFYEGFVKTAISAKMWGGLKGAIAGEANIGANLSKMKATREASRTISNIRYTGKDLDALKGRVKGFSKARESIRGEQSRLPKIMKHVPLTPSWKKAKKLKKQEEVVTGKIRKSGLEREDLKAEMKTLKGEKRDFPIQQEKVKMESALASRQQAVTRGGVAIGGVGAFTLARDYLKSGNKGDKRNVVIN